MAPLSLLAISSYDFSAWHRAAPGSIVCTCAPCCETDAAGRHWKPHDYAVHRAAVEARESESLAELAAYTSLTARTPPARSPPARPDFAYPPLPGADPYMPAGEDGYCSSASSEYTSDDESAEAGRHDDEECCVRRFGQLDESERDEFMVASDVESEGEPGDGDAEMEDGINGLLGRASDPSPRLGPVNTDRWRPVLHPYDSHARVRHVLAPPRPDSDAYSSVVAIGTEENAIVGFVFTLIAITRVALGFSRRHSDFLLRAVRQLLVLVATFLPDPPDEAPESALQEAINSIPRQSRTITSRMGLDPLILLYPICPNLACRYVYPYDTIAHPLPSCCTATRGSQACGEPLVDERGRPLLSLPVRPLHDYLHSLLSRPDLAPYLSRPLLSSASPDVTIRDVADGRIAQLLPSATHHSSDDKFFTLCNRLSISFYYDGVSVAKGVTSNAYSIGVILATVNNLPLHLRNRRENVGCLTILNGPKELPSAAFNRVLQIHVESFKDLWDGFDMPHLLSSSLSPTSAPTEPSPSSAPATPRLDPPTRRIYGVLQNVLGDRPAQTKVLGTTAHTSTSFCPLDNASLASRSKSAAVRARAQATQTYDLNQLEHRTDAEQRAASERWRGASPAERQKLEEQFGIRETPLLELPYFDIAIGGAFDPAHTAFLGAAKWHHYQLHVQTTLYNESPSSFPYLRLLLSRIVTPTDIGRLPDGFTTASSSSLKADQWRSWTEFLLVYCYYHMLYEEPTADELDEIKRRLAKAAATTKKPKSGKGKKRQRADEDDEDESINAAREQGDALAEGDALFLGLVDPAPAEPRSLGKAPRRDFNARVQARLGNGPDAAFALRRASFDAWLLFVRGSRTAFRHSVTPEQAHAAAQLFAQYARALIDVFGPGATTSNHHYLLHVDTLLKLHGGMYATWTMPHERLNGLIASIATNSHPGELEVTLIREYAKEGATLALEQQKQLRGEGECASEVALWDELAKSREDRRGTVGEMQALDERETDPFSCPALGPLTSSRVWTALEYSLLIGFLNSPHSPLSRSARFVSATTPSLGADECAVPSFVLTAAFASTAGFRIAPRASSSTTHDSSLVLAERQDGSLGIARVLFLFELSLKLADVFSMGGIFAFVRWAIPADLAQDGAQRARELAAQGDLGIFHLEPDSYEQDSSESFLPLTRVRARTAYAPGRVAGRPVTWVQTIDRA